MKRLRHYIAIIPLLIAVFMLAPAGAYAATYTGDQGGINLTLENGDYINGTITGVNRFEVPSGITVYVTPWNGSDYGSVIVNAKSIIVAGTISGSAAGYYGYAGGGGGGGGEAKSNLGANGGQGAGSNGAAAAGTSEAADCDTCGTCGGAGGGAGSDALTGKGSYSGTVAAGGAGGANGTAGTAGVGGGYLSVGSNGDSTTSEAVVIGSGGGGGGGGGGSGGATGNCNGNGGAGGGGGGGGGRGGAAVSLIASEYLSVTGSILVKGALGDPGAPGVAPGDVTYGGAGGAGGDAISSTDTGAGGAGGYGRYAEGPPGMVTSGAGGAGGPGAGGGVLLKCNGAWPVIISGTIDTRGGGDSETNFGSLKIFGVKGLITLDGVTINAGWNDAFGTPYNPENQIYVNPVF